MKVISVMSIAGGTGVTTVAAEIIAEKLDDGHKVVAVDLGANQMLERMLGLRSLRRIGNSNALLDPSAELDIRSNGKMPYAGLLNLQTGKNYEDYCAPQIVADVPIGEFLSHLPSQLRKLASHYDICVVDLSQAYPQMMRAFLPFSDEVHFCEREVPEAASWQEFERQYLALSPTRPDQILVKHKDRADLKPMVMSH